MALEGVRPYACRRIDKIRIESHLLRFAPQVMPIDFCFAMRWCGWPDADLSCRCRPCFALIPAATSETEAIRVPYEAIFKRMNVAHHQAGELFPSRSCAVMDTI